MYEYEICVYHRPKEKPAVIKNERIGNGDTSLVLIRGTICDYEKQPIIFVALNLLNLTDSSKYGVITDTSGNFKLYLPAGKYKLKAMSLGYTSLIIDELSLEKGELRELKLQLGNGGAFTSYTIQSDKPLSEKKLKKLEKRLRRKR